MRADGSPRAVRQISGGPASRSYADVFLKHGVPWASGRDDDEFEGEFVRRFASEVVVGDVFLLRTRIATIAAVGLVASGYLYVKAFDDVNGRDVQHTRRARWCRLPAPHAFGSPVFGANPRVARECGRGRSWTSPSVLSTHRRLIGRQMQYQRFLGWSHRSNAFPTSCGDRRPDGRSRAAAPGSAGLR